MPLRCFSFVLILVIDSRWSTHCPSTPPNRERERERDRSDDQQTAERHGGDPHGRRDSLAIGTEAYQIKFCFPFIEESERVLAWKWQDRSDLLLINIGCFPNANEHNYLTEYQRSSPVMTYISVLNRLNFLGFDINSEQAGHSLSFPSNSITWRFLSLSLALRCLSVQWREQRGWMESDLYLSIDVYYVCVRITWLSWTRHYWLTDHKD